MTIRPYPFADHTNCLILFDSNVPTFFAPHERDEFRTWLDELPPKEPIDGAFYYVLEAAGAVVASGGFYLAANGASATLAGGMVDRAQHRQGYGEALLRFRIQPIKARCPSAVVRLDTSQHSYPFFEKMGFSVTNITPDFYAPGLDRYDMIGCVFRRVPFFG